MSVSRGDSVDILETERLLLRPLAMTDLDEIHRLLDLDIQWAGPDFPLSRRRDRLQLHVSLAQWDDTGRIYGNRALVLKPAGPIIGIVGLHPDLWVPAWKAVFWPLLLAWPADDPGLACASLELGIGYVLGTVYRGQGYAAEAARAVLDHALVELRVGRVFAITDRANTDSLRLMQRVGMRTVRNPDPAVVYPGAVGVIENPALTPDRGAGS